MIPITWLWVTVALAGALLALLVLRESLRDRDAASHRLVSPAAMLFLREMIRTTWFRIMVHLTSFAAGIIPATIPLATRPAWARQLTITLLILGQILLTIDTGMRLRAKRRLLRQFRSERNTERNTGHGTGQEAP